MEGGSVRERAEDPPKDRRVARRPLVGAGSWWPRALLPLSTPLPHSCGTIRILFHPCQSGWKTLQLGLRSSGGAASRSYREETSESFPAGDPCVQYGHGWVQHGVLLLPKLGHFEVAAGSSEVPACCARRGSFVGPPTWLRFAGVHL